MNINSVSTPPISNIKTGFTETIIKSQQKTQVPKIPNLQLCPKILNTGTKINNKYFIQSQFPNLTKLKSKLDSKTKSKIQVKNGGKKYNKQVKTKRKRKI
jgi:hypothetical protein